MEDSCHVLKRKKRKTRRCLNEIRNKSRRSTDCTVKNTERDKTVSKMIGQNSSNNYITSNRLTLAIFPKAVRSETITRPLLAEIRHEPGNINLNNIVSKYVLNPETSNNEKRETTSKETHVNNVNNTSANMFSDDDSEDSAKENYINSVIFRMDRASESANDCDIGSANGPSPACSPASRAPRPQGEAYRNYTQFIKDIPMYIKAHTPSLLTEEPVRKCKAVLQNFYLEGRRRLAEEERVSPAVMHEPIVENPVDYLKRGGAAAFPASMASPALPCASPSLTDTPSPQPPSPRDPPSIVQDTPEYTYFPHKLNQ